MEKFCGTANLLGNVSTTGMHMFLSDCGGHASYHNHAKLSCEYSSTAAGHSALVGITLDGRGLYGQYESTATKPTNLDACNGHYGPVPAITVTTTQGSSSVTTTYTYAAATNVYHCEFVFSCAIVYVLKNILFIDFHSHPPLPLYLP